MCSSDLAPALPDAVLSQLQSAFHAAHEVCARSAGHSREQFRQAIRSFREGRATGAPVGSRPEASIVEAINAMLIRGDSQSTPAQRDPTAPRPLPPTEIVPSAAAPENSDAPMAVERTGDDEEGDEPACYRRVRAPGAGHLLTLGAQNLASEFAAAARSNEAIRDESPPLSAAPRPMSIRKQYPRPKETPPPTELPCPDLPGAPKRTRADTVR